MNRYPTWKYVIIGLALLFGLVYTLPNFYGEVPAVQVSPVRATLKSDEALLARVEEIVKKGGVPANGIFHDPSGIKVRFADTDTQIKAKDLLQAQLPPEDYVVALNLLSNTPHWLELIGAKPMYLGLDLRGGVHFLLQVEMRAALTKKMEASGNDIRTALRDKRIQYTGVAREGNTVIVRF